MKLFVFTVCKNFTISNYCIMGKKLQYIKLFLSFSGTPLYEVPENSSWKGSESEETEQYHGFPSPGRPMVVSPNNHLPTSKPNSINQTKQNGSRSNSTASPRGSLPHVEPAGLYSNQNAGYPQSQQRSSTPNHPGNGQPAGMPKKPDAYSLPRTTVTPLQSRSNLGGGESDYASPRSILYNSKLNNGEVGHKSGPPHPNSNQSNGSAHIPGYDKSIQSPHSNPSAPNHYDLQPTTGSKNASSSASNQQKEQHMNGQARHAYDNYAAAPTTAMHHTRPQNAGGSGSKESQIETSFINHSHQQPASSPPRQSANPSTSMMKGGPVAVGSKKAVQFADDVLNRPDVSNVRASAAVSNGGLSNGSHGNGGVYTGSNSQRHDKVPMEVKVTEKGQQPKQNPSFLEDMDCLSYSVV